MAEAVGGGAAGVSPAADGSAWRVKLYRLGLGGAWEDKGTGFARVQHVETQYALVVEQETDKAVLLVHRIVSEELYQHTPGETIIMWSDADIGCDVAISFQEAAGADYVWRRMMAAATALRGGAQAVRPSSRRSAPAEARQRTPLGELDVDADLDPGRVGGELYGPSPSPLEAGLALMDAEALYMPAHRGPPTQLPPPELACLPDLIRLCAEVSPFARERVAHLALQPGYLRRLLDAFRAAEEAEDAPALVLCARAVRALALLNDSPLLEALVGDELFTDCVGALEYDPDAPLRRPGHRAFLGQRARFVEVVPIASPAVRAKIHAAHRLAYLKDVAMAHALDDATFGTLASLAMFNNVEVLAALQAEPAFLAELFSRLRAAQPGSAAWRDLVSFLQELCSLARHMQAAARARLFLSLIREGAFDVITSIMQAPLDVAAQVACTDILIAFLNHDPGALRAYLLGQEGHILFAKMVDCFVGRAQPPPPPPPAAAADADGDGVVGDGDGDGDGAAAAAAGGEGPVTAAPPPRWAALEEGEDVAGVQGQLLDILRQLLDPGQMEQTTDKNDFLELFYSVYMDKLLQVLLRGSAAAAPPPPPPAAAAAAEPPPSTDTLLYVLDLLCFCVRHHNYRIKYYVLRNNLVNKALRLMGRRERPLALAALRLLRCCVELRDNFYDRYLAKNGAFAPVVAAFCANGRRNNLLNSAVLELFEFVRTSNQKALLLHIMEQHGDALAAAGVDEYCSTLRAMRTRSQQYLEGLEVLPPAAPPGGLPVGFVPVGGGERRGLFSGAAAGAGLGLIGGGIDGVPPLSLRFARGASSGDLVAGAEAVAAAAAAAAAAATAAAPRAARHGSMDSREESYFESDDGGGAEEEQSGPASWPPQAAPAAAAGAGPRPAGRGGSPPASPLARLVDYGDGDDGAPSPPFLPTAATTSPPMWLESAGGEGSKRLRIGPGAEAEAGPGPGPGPGERPKPPPSRRLLPIRPIVLASQPAGPEAERGAVGEEEEEAAPAAGPAPEIT